MRLDSLFRPPFFGTRAATLAGRALYARAVEASRAPALYRDLAVPDTVEGRFELYTLHVVILLDRLRRNGPQAAETAQALFDDFVSSLDNALRELGVGDLSVGKKMRRLGEAFYGRVKAYEAAFQALPDTAELEALMARTIYSEVETPRSADLAAYAVAQRRFVADQPLEALLAGRVDWSAP